MSEIIQKNLVKKKCKKTLAEMFTCCTSSSSNFFSLLSTVTFSNWSFCRVCSSCSNLQQTTNMQTMHCQKTVLSAKLTIRLHYAMVVHYMYHTCEREITSNNYCSKFPRQIWLIYDKLWEPTQRTNTIYPCSPGSRPIKTSSPMMGYYGKSYISATVHSGYVKLRTRQRTDRRKNASKS